MKIVQMVMWLTGGGSVHVWGGISHMGKPPCAFWIRCHWSRLSLSSGGPLGSTWHHNNWLLADDNARPHRDCLVDAYLHEQDIIRMDWAPYRPDIYLFIQYVFCAFPTLLH